MAKASADRVEVGTYSMRVPKNVRPTSNTGRFSPRHRVERGRLLQPAMEGVPCTRGKTTYVMNVTKTAASNEVLGHSPSKAGSKVLKSVEDMLSPAQRQEMRDDLNHIAQTRRDAEASSQSLRFR